MAKDKADIFLYLSDKQILPADDVNNGWKAQLNFDASQTSTLSLTKKAEVFSSFFFGVNLTESSFSQKKDAGIYTCKDASANAILTYEVTIAVTVNIIH